LLFALLVLFVFIRCRLTIIICEINLISKLDAKRASLDPGGFRFEWDCLACELFKHGVVNAWDHVGRFNEREGKARLQVN